MPRTRYLSNLELRLEGVRPLHLNTAVHDDGSVLAVELMNPDLQRNGRVVVPKGTVHLLRRKLLLDGACHEHLRLANHGLDPVELALELRLAADCADLFEVRGMQRRQRGRAAAPRVDGATLVFAYEGLDGRQRRTVLRFDPAPLELLPGLARYRIALAPGGVASLQWQIACERPTAPAPPPLTYDAARRRHEERLQRSGERWRIANSNPMFDRWLRRSAADLDMLTTAPPTGPYPPKTPPPTPSPARSCTRRAPAKWRSRARCRSAATTVRSMPRRCS